MPAKKKSSAQLKQERINQLHRCHPARTALLVVDMQRGFLDPGAALEVPKGREVVPNIARLIDCCRALKAPVVFTQFVYSPNVPCLRGDPFGVEHLPAIPGERTGFGFRSSNCLIGPGAGLVKESAEMVPELAPRADELVIAGHTYDKFYGTPLDLALRSRGITHLLVTGVTTDVCVNCTVLAAANRNYYVTAISDGMATIEEALHEACLRIWERKFARVLTTTEALAELKNQAQKAG